MAEDKQTGAALAAWAGNGGSIATSKEAGAALVEAAGIGGGGGDASTEFLSFSGQGANYGGWKLGRDKKSPDPDAIYIVDPFSACEGWTCWKGGGVAQKHEWSSFERATNAVKASELEDHGPYADGDGWQFMLGISMFDIDQPQTKITYTTTSKSGRNTVSDLIRQMGVNMLNDDPCVPIINLASESFTARGKVNGKPTMPVLGWVTKEEVEAFLADADGDIDTLIEGGYAAEGGGRKKKRGKVRSV